MRLSRWLRPRPAAAAERAFIRRWAAVLTPMWGLVALAGRVGGNGN